MPVVYTVELLPMTCFPEVPGVPWEEYLSLSLPFPL
jgi:hypothetical protein